MTFPKFSSRLLDWYAIHKRDLPWRDHPDPYAVWVSEIMLQQTQVETVRPFFARWMARFPTLQALADADEQDVLALWEGLGYYRRARNLHRAARLVMAQHGGRLPADVQALRALPGIGPYTAGAIASMAFGLDEAAIDGNVLRVIARLAAVDERVDTSAGRRRIESIVRAELPSGRAGDFNQALMDLGARICLPTSPRCDLCPLAAICLARAAARQEAYPRRKPTSRKPHFIVTAAVILRGDKVLIAQRPADGLLANLWEFPGGKQEAGESLETCLRREIHEELGVDVSIGSGFGVYRHAYTHFKVTLHAFLAKICGGAPQPLQAQALVWVSLPELDRFPMGKIDRRIARRLQKERA